LGVTHGSTVARSATAVFQWVDLLASFTGLGRARGAGRNMAYLCCPNWIDEACCAGKNLLGWQFYLSKKRGSAMEKPSGANGWFWLLARVFLWDKERGALSHSVWNEVRM